MGHIRIDMPNMNNKWVGFGLANIDMFIIRIGFGLTNVDTIRILIRHKHDPLTQIRPIDTNYHPYKQIRRREVRIRKMKGMKGG